MIDYSGEAARFAYDCAECGKPKCDHGQDYCDDCAEELEREAERVDRQSRRARPGDRTILGGIWSAAEAAAYNALLERVWQYEDDDLTPPEHILNGMHNLYCAQLPPAKAP